MERKIGEIFEYNGEWYQCIPDTTNNNCNNCFFQKNYSNITGDCSSTIRSDGKSVAFKKLEKVGEPYFNGQYGEVLQEYKYYIPPITPDLGIHIIKLGIVGIEIKQNKEDMEENKLNLKPFDIQKAKEGKPVCTREGKKARIICFDKQEGLPIVALIETKKNGRVSEGLDLFHINGHAISVDTDSKHDLMMLPEKKEGWVNLYKSSAYSTKEEAMKYRNNCNDYIDTIKISWEE